MCCCCCCMCIAQLMRHARHMNGVWLREPVPFNFPFFLYYDKGCLFPRLTFRSALVFIFYYLPYKSKYRRRAPTKKLRSAKCFKCLKCEDDAWIWWFDFIFMPFYSWQVMATTKKEKGFHIRRFPFIFPHAGARLMHFQSYLGSFIPEPMQIQ